MKNGIERKNIRLKTENKIENDFQRSFRLIESALLLGNEREQRAKDITRNPLALAGSVALSAVGLLVSWKVRKRWKLLLVESEASNATRRIEKIHYKIPPDCCY